MCSSCVHRLCSLELYSPILVKTVTVHNVLVEVGVSDITTELYSLAYVHSYVSMGRTPKTYIVCVYGVFSVSKITRSNKTYEVGCKTYEPGCTKKLWGWLKKKHEVSCRAEEVSCKTVEVGINYNETGCAKNFMGSKQVP